MFKCDLDCFVLGGVFDSETKSCYVAQAILEHMIHLPQPPKRWYHINNILGSLLKKKEGHCLVC